MSLLPPGFPNRETTDRMQKLRYRHPFAFWTILVVFFAVMIASVIDAESNGGSLIPRPTPGLSGQPWQNPNNPKCGVIGCGPTTGSNGLGYP